MNKILTIFLMITLLILVIVPCQAQNHDLSFDIGVNFGMPSLLNLSLGCTYNNINGRISGIYTDKKNNGVKVSLGYEAYDIENTRHIFGFTAGKSQDPGCDWSFIGPGYTFNDRAFFMQVGVVKVTKVRRGDFSNLPYFPLVQVGYNYRLSY